MANRSLAGLILKNSIRLLWSRLPEQIRTYVKSKTLLAISDPHPLIRATVGIIVTTIVVHEGIAQWPSLLPTLCGMLDSQDTLLQEVYRWFYFFIPLERNNCFNFLFQ